MSPQQDSPPRIRPVNLSLSAIELERIDSYKDENALSTRQDAIRQILRERLR